MRIRVIWRDKAMCRKCGARKGLQVHHLSYARLGHESFDDLICVCKKCHESIHNVR